MKRDDGLQEIRKKIDGVTKDLVKFYHGLQYSDLREDVIRKAKYLLLDFIGVAAAGSQCDFSKLVINFAHETKGI